MTFSGRISWRMVFTLAAAVVASVTALSAIPDPMAARAAAIAATCICLWLSEAVPPFVPTLLLLAAVPLVLLPYGREHSLGAVLTWLADPVLALFFGGFVLGAAIQRHSIDQAIASLALRLSGGNRRWLLILTMGATAALSLWMSNIAATAMMLAALRPLLDRSGENFRRALLVGIAMAANFGGMGTPIGSGPNAVALASTNGQHSFLGWMAIGLPFAIASVVLTWAIICIRPGVHGSDAEVAAPTQPIRASGWIILTLMAVAIIAWLTEPLHGISAPTVGLLLATVFFASGLLNRDDFLRLDWGTLALIGGGISLGRLLEHTGLIGSIAHLLGGGTVPSDMAVVLLVVIAASLSAVMSNTGTATLLIPIANAIDPHRPTLAIIVALACSFGVPFVISTPQNAMASGAGARSADFLRVGLPMMVLGCAALIAARPLIASLIGSAP